MTSTMSEALTAMPPAESLSHVHSGSWINQDFKIWIGHQEDNRGWDLVGHTRARLLERTPSLAPEKAEAAWNELYAAEGSDWFWWYGDDFDTAYKEEFDRLFRTHLRNVWTLAGETPPAMLNEPICGLRSVGAGDRITEPLAFVTPSLDGVVTDFFEWRGAGTISPHPPLGAMWKSEGLFTAIYFGWDLEHLYLRLDPDEASQAKEQNLEIHLYLQTPKRQFRLAFPLTTAAATEYRRWDKTAEGLWRELGGSRLIARRAILELAVPLKDVDIEQDQTVELSLAVLEHGLEIARYPHHQPARLMVPGPDFEATMWRV